MATIQGVLAVEHPNLKGKEETKNSC